MNESHPKIWRMKGSKNDRRICEGKGHSLPPNSSGRKEHCLSLDVEEEGSRFRLEPLLESFSFDLPWKGSGN